MSHDFDQQFRRNNTGANKWDMPAGNPLGAPNPVTDANLTKRPLIPMWVADMDFKSPPAVIDALRERAEQGFFCYETAGPGFYAAIGDWLARRQNWRPEPAWILPICGVVSILGLLVEAIAKPGGKIIIQPPVYHPFFDLAENNDVTLVENPLRWEDGRYEMDFQDLEAKAADPDCKLLVLCNPHNPVGRLWSAGELRRVAEICQRHGVFVASDEIHGDLIFPGRTFTPFASIPGIDKNNMAIAISASKTFNLAGLHWAAAIIPDTDLRLRCQAIARARGVLEGNPFSITAVQAAFRHGDDWLDQVMAYIAGNYAYLNDYLACHLPAIKLGKMDATYLAWLDFRACGLDDDALEEKILNQAGLRFNPGYVFGSQGRGFQRINIACPRSLLEQACQRLGEAFA